jgi:hypothetical protein
VLETRKWFSEDANLDGENPLQVLFKNIDSLTEVQPHQLLPNLCFATDALVLAGSSVQSKFAVSATAASIKLTL